MRRKNHVCWSTGASDDFTCGRHIENLNFLIACLEETGFRIAVARSGEEALERIAHAPPDLILLDVMMPPGMDGFETCRRLKVNAAFREIPVIFMTVASDITVDKMQGFEIGGVDYITKPVQPEEVVARIRTHLTICKLQQELQARNELLQEKTNNCNKRFQSASRPVRCVTSEQNP